MSVSLSLFLSFLCLSISLSFSFLVSLSLFCLSFSHFVVLRLSLSLSVHLLPLVSFCFSLYQTFSKLSLSCTCLSFCFSVLMVMTLYALYPQISMLPVSYSQLNHYTHIYTHTVSVYFYCYRFTTRRVIIKSIWKRKELAFSVYHSLCAFTYLIGNSLYIQATKFV